MQSIADLREKLNGIDRALAELLEQRFEVTDAIGDVKRGSGAAVRDEKREAEVVARVCGYLKDSGKAAELAELYDTLFALSRRRQEKGR